LTTRYGYVGGSGYESAEGGPPGGPADLEFIHVGARWYDPSTGRFLQRDPIGILRGLNVYAYAANQPTELVDPSGNDFIGAEDQQSRRRPRPYDGSPAPEYPSPMAVAEQVQALGSTTGRSDKWMHFVASCRIGSEYTGGRAYILPAGLLMELLDALSGRPIDSLGDTFANGAGWSMAIESIASDGSYEEMADRLGL